MNAKLEYSTFLEEIAYSKDADALFKAATRVIQPQDLGAGKRDAVFFKLGAELGANKDTDFTYFTWHGDDQTILIFQGKYRFVVQAIRELPDRKADSPYR